MELDVRDGTAGSIDAIRYTDTRVIKKVNGDYSIQNNTGEELLKVSSNKVDELILALQTAVRLLG